MLVRNVDKEIAWVAGILEGEGYFYLNKGYYPRIELKMTDKDVVERIAEFIGSTVIKQRYKELEHHKDVWITTKQGFSAMDTMELIYPYMSVRRKETIDAISDRFYG